MTNAVLKKWYDYFEVSQMSQLEIGRKLFAVQELPQGALARYDRATPLFNDLIAKNKLCDCDRKVLLHKGCQCGGK